MDPLQTVADWSPETNAVAAVLAMRFSRVHCLTFANRERVVLIALLLAQKLVDDEPLSNADLPEVYRIWDKVDCQASREQRQQEEEDRLPGQLQLQLLSSGTDDYTDSTDSPADAFPLGSRRTPITIGELNALEQAMAQKRDYNICGGFGEALHLMLTQLPPPPPPTATPLRAFSCAAMQPGDNLEHAQLMAAVAASNAENSHLEVEMARIQLDEAAAEAAHARGMRGEGSASAAAPAPESSVVSGGGWAEDRGGGFDVLGPVTETEEVEKKPTPVAKQEAGRWLTAVDIALRLGGGGGRAMSTAEVAALARHAGIGADAFRGGGGGPEPVAAAVPAHSPQASTYYRP
jgi:hypothetical protein